MEKGNVEGVERNYNILTLRKGVIKDTDKKEIAGADKNKLIPTDIGMVVNDFLVAYFPAVIDFNFTAKVEKDFDQIAEGKTLWSQSIANFYKVFHPIVEETAQMRIEHKVGERVLGTDPKTGRQVSVKIGRYGAMAQIGTTDDEEKPQFASLQKSQSIETITLEETLRLFDLPRNLGLFREKEVVIGVGRFGPYIRHNNKFVSLPKGVDPLEIQLEEAITFIEAKEKKDSEKIIRVFEEEPELQILNGRYGPYIAFDKSNYKIPRTMKAEELSLEDCRQIIAETDKDKEAKPVKKTEKAAAKKSTARKTPVKKAASKKTTAKKTTTVAAAAGKTTTGSATAKQSKA